MKPLLLWNSSACGRASSTQPSAHASAHPTFPCAGPGGNRWADAWGPGRLRLSRLQHPLCEATESRWWPRQEQQLCPTHDAGLGGEPSTNTHTAAGTKPRRPAGKCWRPEPAPRFQRPVTRKFGDEITANGFSRSKVLLCCRRAPSPPTGSTMRTATPRTQTGTAKLEEFPP